MMSQIIADEVNKPLFTQAFFALMTLTLSGDQTAIGYVPATFHAISNLIGDLGALKQRDHSTWCLETSQNQS